MAYVIYWQGLSFSPEWNNTESQGATVLYKATGISTRKWQKEGSYKELTRLVNSTGLGFISCNFASFAFLFSLCCVLWSPFFFVPPSFFFFFFARTVTLSLSSWLCYSACLISRSLIGWLPARREIPFSLPPTHPPTHPPLVRKCERGWWKLIGRAGVLAPGLDVTAGRGALSSLFSVRFGFRQGSKHGMLPSGNSWHTAPLSGFPAPGKCLFLSIHCYCHLVWVLLGCCVCVWGVSLSSNSR